MAKGKKSKLKSLKWWLTYRTPLVLFSAIGIFFPPALPFVAIPIMINLSNLAVLKSIKNIRTFKAIRESSFTFETRGATKGLWTKDIFDGTTNVLPKFDKAKHSVQFNETIRREAPAGHIKRYMDLQMSYGQPVKIEKPAHNNQLASERAVEAVAARNNFIGNTKYRRQHHYSWIEVVRDFFGPPSQDLSMDMDFAAHNKTAWNTIKSRVWNTFGDAAKFHYFMNTWPKLNYTDAAAKAFGADVTINAHNDRAYAIETGDNRFIFIADPWKKEGSQRTQKSTTERAQRNAFDKVENINRPVEIISGSVKVVQSLKTDLKDKSIAVMGDEYGNEDRYMTVEFPQNMLSSKWSQDNYGKTFIIPRSDNNKLEYNQVISPNAEGGATFPQAGWRSVLFVPSRAIYTYVQTNTSGANLAEAELEMRYQNELGDRLAKGDNFFTYEDSMKIYSKVINGLYMNTSMFKGIGLPNFAGAEMAKECYLMLAELTRLEEPATASNPNPHRQKIPLPPDLGQVANLHAFLKEEVKYAQSLVPDPNNPATTIESTAERFARRHVQAIEFRDMAASKVWMRNTVAEHIYPNLDFLNHPESARSKIGLNQIMIEQVTEWQKLDKDQKIAVTNLAKEKAKNEEDYTLFNSLCAIRDLEKKNLPEELCHEKSPLMSFRVSKLWELYSLKKGLKLGEGAEQGQTHPNETKFKERNAKELKRGVDKLQPTF